MLMLTVVLVASVTFATRRYSPPPPPPPELVDAVLPAPLPPAPIASMVLFAEFQSEGTVHVVPEVSVMVVAGG
jgi:hypothetical protein